MDKAGVQAGDFLEAADGYRFNGAPNWFLARAGFERGHTIELQVRRGEQSLTLKLVITEPAWRTWDRAHLVLAVAFYVVRCFLLLLAIFVGFSRPQQLSARLVAVMFAIGAVAEGYPSSGWAAALRHLPAVLAIPIGLATTSCLLASVAWLMFFASFLRHRLAQRLRWALVVVPLVLFGIPIMASVIALIHTPSDLARPWTVILSAAPARLIQDTAGVTPLLFLNRLPLYHPFLQTALLELWLAVTILYFAAGFLILVANYRRPDEGQPRRRVGALLLALTVFATLVVHNFFMRNWTSWFASAPPAFFSEAGFVIETLLLFFITLTLAHCVLSEADTSATRRLAPE
jgi:hypothetical protein